MEPIQWLTDFWVAVFNVLTTQLLPVGRAVGVFQACMGLLFDVSNWVIGE